MKTIDDLLLGNRSWARQQVAGDPGYFERLAHLQQPEFLWLGCSDSRVPANQITGTDPGEVFVHRNVANLFYLHDVNASSVLRYAVTVLRVKHVIVCGHYGCGGIRAVLGGVPLHPELERWLAGVRDLHEARRSDLADLGEGERENRLCEWSVIEQVHALARSPVLQEEWSKSGEGPSLHGWVYGLADGLLRPLIDIEPGGRVAPGGEARKG